MGYYKVILKDNPGPWYVDFKQYREIILGVHKMIKISDVDEIYHVKEISVWKKEKLLEDIIAGN